VSVTDDAIAKIKEMIVSGELQPGDRLPAESELARRLGLSRSSLREAVRALSLVRILDVRQGDGTYVTSLDSDVLLDAMSFLADLHHDNHVMHTLEARRVLEAAVAALAAQYIDDDELLIIHINTNGASAACVRSSHRAQSHATASQYGDSVVCFHQTARHSMKSHRQRFDQAQLFRREFCPIQLLSRHRDEFCKRSVPLHAESLIELARIRTSPPARSAAAAVRIWRESYIGSSRQQAIPLDDRG